MLCLDEEGRKQEDSGPTVRGAEVAEWRKQSQLLRQKSQLLKARKGAQIEALEESHGAREDELKDALRRMDQAVTSAEEKATQWESTVAEKDNELLKARVHSALEIWICDAPSNAHADAVVCVRHRSEQPASPAFVS